jgi:hypothetical protein
MRTYGQKLEHIFFDPSTLTRQVCVCYLEIVWCKFLGALDRWGQSVRFGDNHQMFIELGRLQHGRCATFVVRQP